MFAYLHELLLHLQFHSNLTDAQFLYVDLALATTLSATCALRRPLPLPPLLRHALICFAA